MGMRLLELLRNCSIYAVLKTTCRMDYTQKPKKGKPPEGYNEMINEFKSSSLVKSSFLLNRYR